MREDTLKKKIRRFSVTLKGKPGMNLPVIL